MWLWPDVDIEISSEWAPTLPQEKGVPSMVRIPSGYFDEIEKISKEFTPQNAESPIEFFSGFVTELCGETNEKASKYGDVVVYLTQADGEPFPVTAWLPETQHQDAIKSYEKNIPVYFSGKLIRESGRKKRVRDIGFFKLCNPED